MVPDFFWCLPGHQIWGIGCLNLLLTKKTVHLNWAIGNKKKPTQMTKIKLRWFFYITAWIALMVVIAARATNMVLTCSSFSDFLSLWKVGGIKRRKRYFASTAQSTFQNLGIGNASPMRGIKRSFRFDAEYLIKSQEELFTSIIWVNHGGLEL